MTRRCEDTPPPRGHPEYRFVVGPHNNQMHTFMRIRWGSITVVCRYKDGDTDNELMDMCLFHEWHSRNNVVNIGWAILGTCLCMCVLSCLPPSPTLRLPKSGMASSHLWHSMSYSDHKRTLEHRQDFRHNGPISMYISARPTHGAATSYIHSVLQSYTMCKFWYRNTGKSNLW